MIPKHSWALIVLISTGPAAVQLKGSSVHNEEERGSAGVGLGLGVAGSLEASCQRIEGNRLDPRGVGGGNGRGWFPLGCASPAWS